MMITAIRMMDALLEADAYPAPMFLLFSSDLLADYQLLQRFVPVSHSQQVGDRVEIQWMLPDPDVALGRVGMVADEAVIFRTQNQANGGIRLMLVSEESAIRDTRMVCLEPYYLSWKAAELPATGSALLRARALRASADYAGALVAVAEELRLATGGNGYARHAAYALHEAAAVAEARNLVDAWEYFETLALTLYPNCHDALIGMALCARAELAQALLLLGRAYAIRPREAELRLYGRAFARDGLGPAAIRERIQGAAAEADLDGPALPGLKAIVRVEPDDVERHIQALVRAL